MISQHAGLARVLAGQLRLPGTVRDSVGAAYEQWDGRGWPGALKGSAIPVAARIAQLAEFAEVAHRVGGVPAAVALARVSNSIWARPGPLSAGQWERVRMAPYLTERMLHQSAALAPLGEIAVQHRERLDGSGYPRGLSGGAISRPAPGPRRLRQYPLQQHAVRRSHGSGLRSHEPNVTKGELHLRPLELHTAPNDPGSLN